MNSTAATKPATLGCSAAVTAYAFTRRGNVTARMTVLTNLMRKTVPISLFPNLRAKRHLVICPTTHATTGCLNVRTRNVFRIGGSATQSMIVVIIAMKLDVMVT